MLDPIVKTIEVPCSQEKAFGVFVNEMDSWWPKDKFSISAMGGEAARSVSVDAKQGGKIVETAHDGTEYQWGTIKAYDPYGLFSMDFHIGHPSYPASFYPAAFSLVEVRFTALGDEQTRVELTQSNWESMGEMAEMMHGGYGMGWGVIFEQAYKAACGG